MQGIITNETYLLHTKTTHSLRQLYKIDHSIILVYMRTGRAQTVSAACCYSDRSRAINLTLINM